MPRRSPDTPELFRASHHDLTRAQVDSAGPLFEEVSLPADLRPVGAPPQPAIDPADVAALDYWCSYAEGLGAQLDDWLAHVGAIKRHA